MNKEIKVVDKNNVDEEILHWFDNTLKNYALEEKIGQLTPDSIYHLFPNQQRKIRDYIQDLQKKAELGEHYKHLYSEVKKQKDDVVEDIKKQIIFCTNEAEGTINNDKCWMAVNYLKKLLRMLGEIDE